MTRGTELIIKKSVPFKEEVEGNGMGFANAITVEIQRSNTIKEGRTFTNFKTEKAIMFIDLDLKKNLFVIEFEDMVLDLKFTDVLKLIKRYMGFKKLDSLIRGVPQ